MPPGATAKEEEAGGAGNQPAPQEAAQPESHKGSLNLLANPGFEEVEAVDVDKRYPEILTRGGELATGEALPMPKGWGPSPGDGWLAGQKGIFRFVEGEAPISTIGHRNRGEAGKEVHSGRRAIFLSSKGHAAFEGGGFLRVQEEAIPDQPSLSLSKPNRFSLWAKGSGKLMIYVYTYDKRRSNIYGKSKSTPTEFSVTNSWQKHEGVIEFIGPEVGYCIFVVAVNGGEVTVDDVDLLAQ